MQIGANRTLIRVRTRQICMLGYGALHNLANHALSDLHVRSCVLRNQQGEWLAFANAEICFVTQAIHQEVLQRLQSLAPELHAGNLVLSAQHTHSAPGGYSHYMFYNITIPDFQPDVFEAIVSAFVTSLLTARDQLQPAVLDYAVMPFPEAEEVGFNRSVEAYNNNPENERLGPDQTHLAIDRNMYLLRARSPEGPTLAVLNFFGVHATSIGPDNQGVSADNKGYAAVELEQDFLRQGEQTVCIFAQASAGDVSPNFYGEGKNWPRGKFESQEESARFNGRLQARHAKRILEQAEFVPLGETLDSALIYADLSGVACDPDFCGGETGRRSAPAVHGVAFLKGTAVDGKGISRALAHTVTALCQLQMSRRLKRLQQENPEIWKIEKLDYQMQEPKVVAVETGRRRFLGLDDLGKWPIPEQLDPIFAEVQRLARAGALKEHSWTPQVLPIQILRIGQLALATFPGEITTTAARRLRACIGESLAGTGVSEVVVCSYANAYFGYATTPDEYDLQTYEGGHTVFGRWTMPAFQTLYRRLAKEMAKPRPERRLDTSVQPPVFSPEELSLRSGGRWDAR
ncbi:MAG TPA: neutral/alkaline non-lysosomal ceramidase N-terminal domain-containing protein [Candidatus Obscuribacterales bacterium]